MCMLYKSSYYKFHTTITMELTVYVFQQLQYFRNVYAIKEFSIINLYSNYYGFMVHVCQQMTSQK